MTTRRRNFQTSSRRGHLLIVVGAAAVALGAAGCKSQESATYKEVSSDLTPNLRSTTERDIDIDRHLALTYDQNGRSFWDDLGRTFYTDHPSRLSPYPITSSTGVPR